MLVDFFFFYYWLDFSDILVIALIIIVNAKLLLKICKVNYTYHPCGIYISLKHEITMELICETCSCGHFYYYLVIVIKVIKQKIE